MASPVRRSPRTDSAQTAMSGGGTNGSTPTAVPPQHSPPLGKASSPRKRIQSPKKGSPRDKKNGGVEDENTGNAANGGGDPSVPLSASSSATDLTLSRASSAQSIASPTNDQRKGATGSPTTRSPAGSLERKGSPSPHQKSAMASPKKRTERRKSGSGLTSGRHKRGVSFADEKNRPLAEVYEIERREAEEAGTHPGGCCVVQ